MKNNSKNMGFTLIELLVAMAIIGILAGVVLVSMSSYRTKALQTAALQTLSSVMPAAVQCALNNPNNSGSAAISEGASVCTGSDITWPHLGNGSNTAWQWGNIGWMSGGLWYYGICNPGNVGGPYCGAIVCSTVDIQWWVGSDGLVRGGTCLFHN